MKKLFISMPMKDIPREMIEEKMRTYAANIEHKTGEKYEVIPLNDDVDVKNPLYCLGESLQKLSSADTVYFAPGWGSARGCRIEYECVMRYGIPENIIVEQ